MTQMAQNTMHAAAIDAFGGAITPHEVPVPRIASDEILIRVQAAGVGVWDPFELEGGFAKMMGLEATFPYVLGSEGAGEVVDVGSAVSGFKPGDHVYAVALANPKGGFYAQYAAVPANHASAIPHALSVDQAGVMPVDALTALMGLDALHLEPGQSILIFGASGGIGHMAVQLAKRMRARVLAVASGPDGVAMVRGLGADTVVDGHQDEILLALRKFAVDGLDCALLTAGGKAADEALMAVRKGGRVAYPNGVEPVPSPRPGIEITSYDGIPTPETIARLNQLIQQAPFEVHVARTFPLDQAAEAHRALEKHYLGKIALHPAQ